jgi:choline monooxygenase
MLTVTFSKNLRPLSKAVHFSTVSIAKSLPAEVYTEESFFKIDRQCLLGPKWQLLTHESLLLKNADQSPATYLADSVSGWPCIVVRNSSTGEYNAFHNVCRHRGGPFEWEGSSGQLSV